jgi:hypothetical protein
MIMPSNPYVWRIAAQNYGLAIAFTLFVALFSKLMGDAAGLVALKTIVAPMYLMANRALPTYFLQPIIEPVLTYRAVEFHLLTAAVFAGFLIVLMWSPDQPLPDILTRFGITFLVMSVGQIVILMLNIRRLRGT